MISAFGIEHSDSVEKGILKETQARNNERRGNYQAFQSAEKASRSRYYKKKGAVSYQTALTTGTGALAGSVFGGKAGAGLGGMIGFATGLGHASYYRKKPISKSAFGIDHGDVEKAFSIKRGFAMTSKERALRAANGRSMAPLDQKLASKINNVERSFLTSRANKLQGSRKQRFAQAAKDADKYRK